MKPTDTRAFSIYDTGTQIPPLGFPTETLKYIFYSFFETPHFTNDQLSPKAGVPGTAGVLEGTVASPFIGEVSDPHGSQ